MEVILGLVGDDQHTYALSDKSIIAWKVGIVNDFLRNNYNILGKP